MAMILSLHFAFRINDNCPSKQFALHGAPLYLGEALFNSPRFRRIDLSGILLHLIMSPILCYSKRRLIFFFSYSNCSTLSYCASFIVYSCLHFIFQGVQNIVNEVAVLSTFASRFVLIRASLLSFTTLVVLGCRFGSWIAGHLRLRVIC